MAVEGMVSGTQIHWLNLIPENYNLLCDCWQINWLCLKDA